MDEVAGRRLAVEQRQNVAGEVARDDDA